jgi:hypothetical protein
VFDNLFNLSATSPNEAFTAVAVLAEGAAYFLFYHLGKSMNARRPGQRNIGPRGLACIAVLVVAGWLARYYQANFIDAAVYATLSVREQGEYVGRLWRSAFIPAIALVGISAARAWRDKQERVAIARKAQQQQS